LRFSAKAQLQTSNNYLRRLTQHITSAETDYLLNLVNYEPKTPSIFIFE
jgi:hypothetical protein